MRGTSLGRILLSALTGSVVLIGAPALATTWWGDPDEPRLQVFLGSLAATLAITVTTLGFLAWEIFRHRRLRVPVVADDSDVRTPTARCGGGANQPAG